MDNIVSVEITGVNEFTPPIQVEIDTFQAGVVDALRVISDRNKNADYGTKVIFLNETELRICRFIQYLGQVYAATQDYTGLESLADKEVQDQIIFSIAGIINAKTVLESIKSSDIFTREFKLNFLRSVIDLTQVAERSRQFNNSSLSLFNVSLHVSSLYDNSQRLLSNSQPSLRFAKLLICNYYNFIREKRFEKETREKAKQLRITHSSFCEYPPDENDLLKAGLKGFMQCENIINILKANPELIKSRNLNEVRDNLVA